MHSTLRSPDCHRPTPTFALTILALAVTVTALSGCGGATGESDSDAYRVGLVFDVGGRGDKSFNDAAYAGLDSAKKDLGIEYEYIEPGEGGDRESALRQLAAGGNDLVIGVGFLFTDDIRAVAEEFPDKQFACVDMTIHPGDTLPPNLVALKFKEEDGSFLIGALAALVAESSTVGFLGGMEIPLIKKFEAGYKAGVGYVEPDCRVLVKYVGTEAGAFKNPTKGKELGLAMYQDGADVVYHASGSTGLGLFEAAEELDKLAIGVDSDQYEAMPGHILTSMIKRVDIAVYNTIEAGLNGTFPGGEVKTFGLGEDGVGIVYDDRNADLIPAEAYTRVMEIRDRIVSGEIEVPSS